MKSTVARSSAFIFQLCTGFGGLPQHLTEEAALLDCSIEDSMNSKPKKRVRLECEGDERGAADVKLNDEVSVELHDGSVRARVTRVEANNDTPVIYAKPISSQFGGRFFEFQLEHEDYKAAALRADNEVLDSVGGVDLVNNSDVYSK